MHGIIVIGSNDDSNYHKTSDADRKNDPSGDQARGGLNSSSGGNAVSQTHNPARQMEMRSRSRERADAIALINQGIKAKEQMAVPTNDKVVKERLRELGQPICLFGEGAYERRDRLRSLMSGEKNIVGRGATEVVEEEAQELFFTEGPHSLKQWRLRIANYSLKKAKARLKMETLSREDALLEEDAHEKYMNWVQASVRTECSQVGDIRPLTQCRFSPDGSQLCTSSWTGLIKLWDACTGNHVRTFRGHKERCHAISFRPQAGPRECGLASAGSDGQILLWDLENGDGQKGTLTGHEERVNRLTFHPQGGLLASTSHDTTWRLWDIETHTEILLQEGHAKPTYGVAFHPDGSLVATSDLGGVCRLWDVRTGRTIMPLVGHHKQVLSLDFHPMGYALATASDDNSVKLWDLRKRKCVTSISAHHKLISEVKFEPVNGKFLLTASYDNTVKLWSTETYECIKSLVGHEARVMGADVTGATIATKNQHRICTASYDRTFKLWFTAGKRES
eukprot:GEMP01016112.1.p1 GENE.GEMP01016112.1~~GEMP01016112.1.p1  ORF type:complete len:507 (+),score=79.39 GEMP01016112.1:20-1540(+)